MTQVSFDRFFNYTELTSILEGWASSHAGLFQLSSIGKSHESREIWLCTVTNLSTGPDTEKPALWLDANIHASEVTGCTAALHLVDKLLRQHGADTKVTRVLDTRAFYIVPRLNPDGAELALAERPRFIRSSVRPYPRTDRQDGLHEQDIDGDGRVLMMRIPDANGAWKPHIDDARLMVAREPDETPEDGRFYRVLPEGLLHNFDGTTIKVAKAVEGLDMNRNYPMEWAPEGEQHGAGPFPTSEPEVRAMVLAMTERPNITAHITYHTYSGVHLRPYSSYDDERFPPVDLRTYKKIGEHATRITGYPAVSVFHDFKYEPKSSIKGGADDWSYEHLGIYSWTTEFWNPQKEAGITDFHMIEWLREHSVADDLKLLAWSDDKLGGKGYIDWYPFDHPQLGRVELGGWDVFYCWSNPPPERLEQEIGPHADFAIFLALISPKLEIESLDVDRISGATFKVRAVLINSGWLSSNVTQKALDRKVSTPVEAELKLPPGARVVGGDAKVELGQLEGRAEKRSLLWWFADESSDDRTKVEWVVECPRGGSVAVEARHHRAGYARAEAVLSAGE
ncbi:MAG: carboxypeptidase [Actinobacteria bacterium]|nr:carboxypeptidase [Actinomycetota bacterium]